MAGKYEIILADFPWAGYTPNGTAVLPYESMTWESIRNFPWPEFTAKRFILFSWCTSSGIDAQMEVHAHWRRLYGWRSLGVPFTWIKTKKDGSPMGASGPRPGLVKPKNEFVVAYTNVKHGRAFPLLTESMNQDVYAPRGAHSEKPPEVRDRIVQLLGDRPRLELFARQEVDGWDQIGAEAKTRRIF